MFPLYHVNARYTSVLPAMLLDRGAVRAPRPLLGLPLLGHLPRRGSHRVQLHGRARADALQAARAGRRRRQPGASAPTGHPRPSRCSSASSGGSASSSSRSTARPSSARASRTAAGGGGSAPAAARGAALRRRDPRRGRQPRRRPESRARSWCARASRSSWWRSTSAMPEATLAAFRNLWFHTGDRGRTDADGLVLLRRPAQGRDPPARREHLVVGGRAGRQRPRGGGRVGGDRRPVRAHRGGGPGRRRAARRATSSRPRQLLDFCQERLPHFAVPRYVRFVDELPKNHAQRIQKHELRAEGVTSDTWDREEHGYVVTR